MERNIVTYEEVWRRHDLDSSAGDGYSHVEFMVFDPGQQYVPNEELNDYHQSALVFGLYILLRATGKN